jgi:hypothetical protein
MKEFSRRRFLGAGAATVGGAALATSTLASAANAVSALPTLDLVVPTVHKTAGLVVTLGCTTSAVVGLVAWRTSDPSTTFTSTMVSTKPGPSGTANAARVSFDPALRVGLDGTAWTYQPMVQPSDLSQGPCPAGPRLSIPARPMPGQPSTISFNYACCTSNVGSVDLTAVEPNGQFMAWIGDLAHIDNPLNHPQQDYGSYSAVFRSGLTTPGFATVLSRMPFYGMQDDHDYGVDGAVTDPAYPTGYPTATPSNNKTWRSYTAQAYADLVPNAAYPNDSYQDWQIGQVHFLLLDSRRYREDKTPTNIYPMGYRSQLGVQQWAWVKSTMQASTARAFVLFFPMTPTWDTGQAGASQCTLGERTAMFNFFGTLPQPVLICSGDRHAGAIGQWGNVTEMLAAPTGTTTRHTIPDFPGTVWANATATVMASQQQALMGRVTIDTTATPGSARLDMVRVAPGKGSVPGGTVL